MRKKSKVIIMKRSHISLSLIMEEFSPTVYNPKSKPIDIPQRRKTPNCIYTEQCLLSLLKKETN